MTEIQLVKASLSNETDDQRYSCLVDYALPRNRWSLLVQRV